MESAKCAVCGNSYSSTSSLNRHLKNCHSIYPLTQQPSRDFGCGLCGKFYTTKQIVRTHIIRHHLHLPRGYFKVEQPFTCETCQNKFASACSLRTHRITFHGEESSPRKSCIVCPVCGITVSLYKDLDQHLADNHNFTPEWENINFKTWEEFTSYKKALEGSQCSFFRKQSGRTNKIYYECHRSGPAISVFPRKDGTSRRKKLGKQSSRIGAECPARMVVTLLAGRVHASVQKSHAGHDCSVSHLRLRKEERSAIAAKIISGIPFDQILDEVKKSAENQPFGRIHLIKKKDLYNITRDFRLKQFVTPTDSLDATETFEDNVSYLVDIPSVNDFSLTECAAKREDVKKKLREVSLRVDTLPEETLDSLSNFLDTILFNPPTETSELSLTKPNKPARSFITKSKGKSHTTTNENKKIYKVNSKASNSREVLQVYNNFDHTYIKQER